MATSQNGWSVKTSSSGLAPLSWVTGRVQPGDVHTIFDYLCRRFDDEVENIIVGHSWGWAYRPVRGSSSGYSNHASGTAIDLNAPAHPIGKWNTFSSAKKKAIRNILDDLDGVVRWGGDYKNRPDDMHFEINASSQKVAQVAAGLKTKKSHSSKPVTPKDWFDMATEAEVRKIVREELLSVLRSSGVVPVPTTESEAVTKAYPNGSSVAYALHRLWITQVADYNVQLEDLKQNEAK